jgi:aminopeptidase N
LSVRGYDADGTGTTVEVMLEGDTVEVALGNDLIVPDADDDTWAKIRLDATSLANLPAVLPKVADGTTRAVIWNSIRDATAYAEFDPRQALELFVTAIQHEDSDIAVGSLVRWLEDRVLGGYLPYDESRAAVADALSNKLATAEPGSSLQLATVRGLIAAADDAALLQAWLGGSQVPDGLEVDAELRWALVLRLVRLNVFGAAEIDAELARDTSTEGVIHAARCRSALPDGKEAAWTRIMTDPTIGVKELLAAAEGFWHPGQAAATAPYVERFFTDIHRTAEIRSGMVVSLTVSRIAPRYAIDADLIPRAEAMIADETVAPGIRRQTANFLDDLRKAVAVRRTFS